MNFGLYALYFWKKTVVSISKKIKIKSRIWGRQIWWNWIDSKIISLVRAELSCCNSNLGFIFSSCNWTVYTLNLKCFTRWWSYYLPHQDMTSGGQYSSESVSFWWHSLLPYGFPFCFIVIIANLVFALFVFYILILFPASVLIVLWGM